jgi:hypothetical protein
MVSKECLQMVSAKYDAAMSTDHRFLLTASERPLPSGGAIVNNLDFHSVTRENKNDALND